MPTPMTIEMENEMTKDEIQAAIIFINDKFDQDYIETEEYYHIFKYHGDTIRAALQSQLTKNDENVTCGNLSNADEIQAALDELNNHTDTSGFPYEGAICGYEGEIILSRETVDACRAALQSALDAQQSNADTVDLDALKEKMISDFEEERESELGRGYELGLCHAVDYLAQNHNITRRTK